MSSTFRKFKTKKMCESFQTVNIIVSNLQTPKLK